jgi:hypothetical protein
MIQDLPPVLGFPAEPWKFVGVRRLVWLQRPLSALYTIHILLAQLLNLAADKDDLPIRVAFPRKLGELVFCWAPGRGDVFKNPTWRSFFRWLESAERAPERLRESLDQQRHRAAVRQLIADKQTRPIALSPLSYDHALGPTGTGPKTLGHVGGGNHSGTARPRPTFDEWGMRVIWPLAGWNPQAREQKRHFEAKRKQFSRIKANGGKRRPVGRPRTISADKEKRVRELLAAGWGIKRIRKEVDVGVSFIQRIRGTANRPG